MCYLSWGNPLSASAEGDGEGMSERVVCQPNVISKKKLSPRYRNIRFKPVRGSALCDRSHCISKYSRGINNNLKLRQNHFCHMTYKGSFAQCNIFFLCHCHCWNFHICPAVPHRSRIRSFLIIFHREGKLNPWGKNHGSVLCQGQRFPRKSVMIFRIAKQRVC